MVIKRQVEPGSVFDFKIESDFAGRRLDHFLSDIFTRYSRSFFKRLIVDGEITVNTKKVKAGVILTVGDAVHVSFPRLPDAAELKAFDGELGVKIVAEHPDFLIVYKPAGLMVHRPNHYSVDVTLVDWLLRAYQELVTVGFPDRPGIVHRLDKDTSGLLIIARSNFAHMTFSKMFRMRNIEKTYWALVKGHPDRQGIIDFSIGRDPIHKHKMAHQPSSGKVRSALTHYRVLAYYADYSLLEVKIETGRTHQIRVHLAAIGHSVLGDSLYGEASKIMPRQALHAKQIAFEYEGKKMVFDWPVPEDMQRLIDQPKISGASEEDFPSRPAHS